MKRFALLLAAAATCLGADPAAPKLEFVEKDFIFEPVMVGTVVTHAFKFKNTGQGDLVIRRVDPTCGCTVTKFPKDPVKPGGEGAVELAIDTTEKMGACLVRATVYSNDSAQNVLGPCTSLLEVKGEVVTCFKLMPLGAYFGPVLRGREPVSREIRASGNLDARGGFEVTSIDVPVDWIKVDTRPLSAPELSQAAAEHGVGLKITVLPNVPPGEFHEWVVVHTNIPKQPTFRFPLVGSATGPIKVTDQCLLGTVKRGTEPDRLVVLERIDNQKGLSVVDLEYDKARFSVTSETIVDGVRTDVHVKVRKDAPIGPFASHLVVKVDLPEQPVVKVALLGEIAGRVRADPPLLLVRPGETQAHLTVAIDKGKLLKAHGEGFDAKIEGDVVRLVATKTFQRGALVLETDVPGEETVRVPIEVR